MTFPTNLARIPGSGPSLNLQTEGGFSGTGALDIVLQGGMMYVASPWGQPAYCEAYLDADDYGALYALHATFAPAGGAVSGATTEWCDESMTGGTMPQPLLDLIHAAQVLASDVMASCAG